MNKKLPYDLTKEEIAELLKRKKEISDFVFEQFKSDPMNKEINWKQAHDMQQKLVISYVLENEKLKDRIKELELSSNKLDQSTTFLYTLVTMSRNLKFRVRDKLNKTFIYSDKGYQGHYVLTLDGKFQNLQNGSGGDEYIVQDYIGLKDKNGKDIYEGDLINFSINNTVELGDADIMDYKNQDVHYSEEYASFMFGEDGFTPLDRIIMTSIEVVGNIFEK